MRVFVTGATGFIGTALIKELLAHGHTVLGMTRSDEGAAALKKAGVESHFGTIEDLDSLKAGAAKADGAVHLAFNHDFSRYVQNCEDDRRAIDALASVLKGKPLLITSGTAMANTAPGEVATEDTPAPPASMIPRAASEEAGLAASKNGVKVSIIRLPQVHDTEKFGLISPAIDIAKAKGKFAYIGDGQTRWPAAHVSDVAVLYRLALEKAAPYAVYNAVGEEGVTNRAIAEAVAPRLGIPAVSIPPEEAGEYFGWLPMFATRDLPASAEKTRKALGWQPKGPTMVEDLKQYVPA